MILRKWCPERIGDLVFVPVIVYAAIAESWWWFLGAFVIGWAINMIQAYAMGEFDN